MDKNYLLENFILSVLAYYDALGKYPLTLFEIYRYLAGPIKQRAVFNFKVEFCRIKDILENSQRIKRLVSRKNGFYFLNRNQEKVVKERIEHQKIADKKWKKTRRIIKWFQAVPYLRMAAVSGSLSLNNTKEESDLDLLVSAKYGRVWTVRTLLTVLTQIIGQRRHGKAIKDRICLNQYLTDRFPEIRLKNLSNAHSCVQLAPILGITEFSRFIQINNWLNDYFFFYPVNQTRHFRIVKENRILKSISRFLENILDNKAGDLIEKSLERRQKKRIIGKTKDEYIAFSFNEIIRKKNKAHLCLSNKGLIFHYPISRNLQVQKKYFKIARDLDINIFCG